MQINVHETQELINILQSGQRFKGNEYVVGSLVTSLGGYSGVVYSLSEGELALYLIALLIRKLGESQ